MRPAALRSELLYLHVAMSMFMAKHAGGLSAVLSEPMVRPFVVFTQQDEDSMQSC